MRGLLTNDKRIDLLNNNEVAIKYLDKKRMDGVVVDGCGASLTFMYRRPELAFYHRPSNNVHLLINCNHKPSLTLSNYFSCLTKL